jgi:hypothetical protein
MSQHFLLCSAARTLILGAVVRMSDLEVDQINREGVPAAAPQS